MNPKELIDLIPEERREEALDAMQQFANLSRKLKCATARAIIANIEQWEELEKKYGENWHYNYGYVDMRVKGEEIDAVPYAPFKK